MCVSLIRLIACRNKFTVKSVYMLYQDLTLFISSTSHGPHGILSNPHLSKNTKNGTVMGSDVGSISDMHHSSSSTDGKSSSAIKCTSRQISQVANTSASNTPPTSKAKTQWSEHVWSKYYYHVTNYIRLGLTRLIVFCNADKRMSNIYIVYSTGGAPQLCTKIVYFPSAP